VKVVPSTILYLQSEQQPSKVGVQVCNGLRMVFLRLHLTPYSYYESNFLEVGFSKIEISTEKRWCVN
jgi:hypothetical protein